MTTTTPSILDTLDDEQLRAATSRARDLLIVAGPGSGKTRTLTARIVWLLRERKMPSHQVLCLVFTRAAAAEVRNRVIAEVGEDRAKLLTVATFHAWALRWLRKGGAFDGLRVGHDDELKAIFEGLYAGSARRPETRRVGKKTLRAFLRDRAAMGAPFVNSMPDGGAKALSLVYFRRCAMAGLIDPDQILPTFEERDVEPFHAYAHVLVDEAHDLTPLEARLVRVIHAESTLVLDPRQAIHEWRGADVSTVMRLWAGAERVELRRTYRFGPAIAAAANVAHLDVENGVPPVTAGEGVADRVEERPADDLLRVAAHMIADYGPSNCAILARTNLECDRVADALGSAAYRVRREDDRNLRAAAALARLVVRLDDDVAYRDLWRQTGGPLDALREIEAHASRAYSLAAAARMLEVAPEWQSWVEARQSPCFGACWYFIHRRPLPEELEALDGLDCEAALDALAERQDADAFASVGLRVAVCTAHAAKGREWPAVAFIDFKARTEEDHRIRFVALTRARTHLVVLKHSEEDR